MFAIKFITLCTLSLLSPIARANDAAAKNNESSDTKLVLKAISQKYAALGSWQAQIAVEQISKGIGIPKSQVGKIYFARPDRFRYEITTIPATLAVSDGKEYWYGRFAEGIKKPGQVKHAKSLSGVELDQYLAFLRGIDVQNAASEKKLFQDFQVEGRYEKTHLVLKLTPKRSNSVKSIEMHFMQIENHPNKIVIEDMLENITNIKVFDPAPFGKINPELFAPKFAKGTTIESF